MKTKRENIIDILKEAKEHDVPLGLTATAIEQLEPEGEVRGLLIHFLDSIRDYEHESHNLLGHDERESSEFVDIYLKDNITPPPQQPSEGEIETINNWLHTVTYHIDELERGYAEITVFIQDRKLFERLLNQKR